MPADSRLRVLFVSSGAGFTGAPRVLLTLARHLVEHDAIRPAFLLRSGGPLARDFAELGPVATLDTSWSPTAPWYRGPVYDAHVLSLAARLALRTRGFDLCYSNTITNGRVLRALRPLRLPVLTHVHELARTVATFVTPSSLQDTERVTDAYIACSRAVEHYLTAVRHVDAARLHVVYGFVDTEQLLETRAPGALRNALGATGDAVLVGGCGTLDERKGADLFVEVATILREQCPELFPVGSPSRVRFVWFGGRPDEVERFRADACARGLADLVTFLGETPDAARQFTDLDVFLLTSREDPYPLVVLECATYGVPSIVFDGSGGAPEFVEHDAGVQVPHLDVDAMAEELAGLVRDPVARDRLGRAAAAKVVTRHDLRMAAPRILEIMQQTASGRSPRR